MKIGEFNAITSEQIVRDMTDEEVAQREAEIAEYKIHLAAKEAAVEQLKIAKAAAEAKLAALGLTPEDLKALGLA